MLTKTVLIFSGLSQPPDSFLQRVEKTFGKTNCHLYRSSPERPLSAVLTQRTGPEPIVLLVEYACLLHGTFSADQKLYPPDCLLIIFDKASLSGRCLPMDTYDFLNIGENDDMQELFFSRLVKEVQFRCRLDLLQRQLAEFYGIGAILSGEKDTRKLLEQIVESSINLTGSDAGTIYVVSEISSGKWCPLDANFPEGRQLEFVIAKNRSIPFDFTRTTTPICTESIAGYTVITGRSLRIEDAYLLSPSLPCRHDASFDLRAGYKTRSMLSIPMKDHEGRILGVIQLINKLQGESPFPATSTDSPCSYDTTDELVMNSLAAQAAIALENSLLYRDMQALLQEYQQQNTHLSLLSRKVLKAHEEERRRIAREIHDGPAQSSAGLTLKLELCRRLLRGSNLPALEQELDDLTHSSRAGTREIRTIIYDLKPSFLDEGLIKAIESRLDLFTQDTGIDVLFFHTGTDEHMEDYMTSTLYRIVQEALSNVRKYAAADMVRVTLDLGLTQISLSIRDNGIGFDPHILEGRKKSRLEGGYGLEGIQERLALVRGCLEIDSTPGEGTCLHIEIPVWEENLQT